MKGIKIEHDKMELEKIGITKGSLVMRGPLMLQDKAYTYLIDKIKNGDLEADRIYSLNQMAKEIGISRTPLRDAVMKLAQERYIDVLPSKGFVLHKMTSEDMVETYQIRNAIESFCLKQLSRNINTERGQQYFNKITGKVDSMKEILSTSRSTEDFGRKDYEFHRSIVQYVGNETMLEMYRSFMYRIFWLNVSSFTREGRMEDTLSEHELMLRLIHDGDTAAIDTLLEHHLRIPMEINQELL